MARVEVDGDKVGVRVCGCCCNGEKDEGEGCREAWKIHRMGI